jgi:hypothetical protein
VAVEINSTLCKRVSRVIRHLEAEIYGSIRLQGSTKRMKRHCAMDLCEDKVVVGDNALRLLRPNGV